jgi:biotin transporter BioY
MEVILIWIASAALCGWMASNKNRSIGLWVVVGLLTGLIGVVILACLSKVEVETSGPVSISTPPKSAEKRSNEREISCPFCAFRRRWPA